MFTDIIGKAFRLCTVYQYVYVVHFRALSDSQAIYAFDSEITGKNNELERIWKETAAA